MILFSLAACTEPSMKRINNMAKKHQKIEVKYQETETAFENLVRDCAELDAFLRNANTPKIEMQLLRAYLQQYEDERFSIQKEIEYSKSQISDLKDDFNEGLYDAEKREEYLTSEEKALNTIDAKLDYFIDRFQQQSDFIKNAEKQ